jgi:hypothetical protein
MTIHREVKNTQGLTSKYMRIALGGTLPSFVLTGFEASKSSSMDVGISAGTAYIKDSGNEMYEVTSSATETLTLTGNDVTNYIFLHCDNGLDWLTFSTTATVPDDAILIATVVTVMGNIDSITDNRLLTTKNNTRLLTEIEGTHEIGLYSNWAGYASPPLYLYLNKLQTDKITLTRLRYSYTITNGAGKHAWLYTYYNVGAGETQIAYRIDTSGTEDISIGVSTSAITTIPYIRFAPDGDLSQTWSFTITNIYLEYELID